MAAQLATRCRIKQKRRWVRRPTSGRTVYAYVSGNPVNLIDPLGLQDAPPGFKQMVSGRYEVNGGYYLRRALEALGFGGTFLAGSGNFGQQYANQWSATHVVGREHNGWTGKTNISIAWRIAKLHKKVWEVLPQLNA